jgi:long-chain fatty acid transport protein
MRSLRLGARAALLVALLLPPSALAGGFAITDVGARETGMGAEVGRPDEPAAVYHNPAGLTLLPGVHLYISAGGALPQSTLLLRPWSGSSEFINAPVSAQGFYPAVQPTTAFSVIPMAVVSAEVIRNKLWAALSAYVPNAQGGSFDPNAVTRYQLISAYAVAGYGGLTLAYKPDRHVSIGLSGNVVYIQTALNKDLYPVLNGGDYSLLVGPNPGLALNGSSVTYGFNLGVLVRPIPTVSIGVSVISGNDDQVDGTLNLQPSKGGALTAPFTGTQETNLYIPWTLLVGANWDVLRRLEIGAELHYWFYKGFQTQTTQITWTSHTGLEDLLPDSLVSQEDYSNSWRVSGGVRVHDLPHLGTLEIMAGGHYDASPVPDATVSLSAPSFDSFGAHLGLRYTLKGRYRIGLTYVHYWYLERNITDSVTNPPSDFEATGDNNILTLALEVSFGGGYVER